MSPRRDVLIEVRRPPFYIRRMRPEACSFTFTLFALVFAGLGCQKSEGPGTAARPAIAVTATFPLSSDAFTSNATMPVELTCEGGDVSPPLAWSAPPAGTKSFALVVYDPDAPDPAAPKQTWVHWVVYDIPGSASSIPKGGPIPDGSRAGLNDFKRTAYGGPCPPIGRHRYFHVVYAVDKTLGDIGTPTRAELEHAIENHVLAKGELVGTYQKTK
jgi:Raf kinase inhibitor-like YbhB/YbcL family protein